MKTFGEIKQNNIEKFYEMIDNVKKLEKQWQDKRGGITHEESHAIKRGLEEINKAIDNLDEATIIMIGRYVNNLINSIKIAFLNNDYNLFNSSTFNII